MKHFLLSILVLFTINFTFAQDDLDLKMITAAAKGDVKKVNTYLKKGANINAKNRARWTALAYATKYKHVNVVKYLVENGANINKTVNTGSTPLQIALNQGSYDIADYLIKNNADVNVKDIMGMSALAWAAKSNKLKVVKYLLENGADINSKNNGSRSVLDITINADMKEFLKSKGAKTSEKLLTS